MLQHSVAAMMVTSYTSSKFPLRLPSWRPTASTVPLTAVKGFTCLLTVRAAALEHTRRNLMSCPMWASAKRCCSSMMDSAATSSASYISAFSNEGAKLDKALLASVSARVGPREMYRLATDDDDDAACTRLARRKSMMRWGWSDDDQTGLSAGRALRPHAREDQHKRREGQRSHVTRLITASCHFCCLDAC